MTGSADGSRAVSPLGSHLSVCTALEQRRRQLVVLGGACAFAWNSRPRADILYCTRERANIVGIEYSKFNTITITITITIHFKKINDYT